MYLLQLVQALKYENFSDIQGGLEPGSKRDSQGLSDDSALDRSVLGREVITATPAVDHKYVNTTSSFDRSKAHMEVLLWSVEFFLFCFLLPSSKFI